MPSMPAPGAATPAKVRATGDGLRTYHPQNESDVTVDASPQPVYRGSVATMILLLLLPVIAVVCFEWGKSEGMKIERAYREDR